MMSALTNPTVGPMATAWDWQQNADAGENLRITENGMRELGSWEPLPAGSGLVDYWRARLGKAERLILETLTQAYPDALTKEEVAAKAGYEPNGGGFNNALGRLRTLDWSRGVVSCRRAIICLTAERSEKRRIEECNRLKGELLLKQGQTERIKAAQTSLQGAFGVDDSNAAGDCVRSTCQSLKALPPAPSAGLRPACGSLGRVLHDRY
jgi:hypothetical protein